MNAHAHAFFVQEQFFGISPLECIILGLATGFVFGVLTERAHSGDVEVDPGMLKTAKPFIGAIVTFIASKLWMDAMASIRR